MRRRSAPPVVLLIFGLLLLAVSGVLSVLLWDAWSLQRRAATVFVRTAGTVLDVQVVERRSGRRNSHVYWAVEFDYRYEVAGQPYTSDREYFLGSNFTSHEAAMAHAAAHPNGSAIEVFVDPDDPTQCTLDNTPPDALPLLFPLLPFAFGLGSLWFWRRLLARRRKA